jgi:hypothetical protein
MSNPFNDCELFSACKLIDGWGSHNLDCLYGPSNAKRRQAVMSILLGRNMPLSKCGYTAVQKELWKRAGVEGNCIRAREVHFAAIMREQFGDTLGMGAMRF